MRILHYSSRILGILFLLLGVTVGAPVPRAAALPVLSLTLNAWEIVGLDSNNVNVGPNQFMIGIRGCNSGVDAATNVQAQWVWDSTNSYVNLATGTASTVTLASLPASTCANFYFNVEVTRTSAAYDTTRRFHITLAADGVTALSTPT